MTGTLWKDTLHRQPKLIPTQQHDHSWDSRPVWKRSGPSSRWLREGPMRLPWLTELDCCHSKGKNHRLANLSTKSSRLLIFSAFVAAIVTVLSGEQLSVENSRGSESVSINTKGWLEKRRSFHCCQTVKNFRCLCFVISSG